MGGVKDHYRTLGLDEDASMDDVKRAYKNLAKKWHPDKNPERKNLAEKNFKDISEAYQILSDGIKRYEYDKERHDTVEEEEMRRKREHDEKIRRMDREQKEYVRKQEARKARGRYGGKTDNIFTDFTTDDHDRIFDDFFTETVGPNAPNFTHNPMFENMMKDMNDLMKAAFQAAQPDIQAHKGLREAKGRQALQNPRGVKHVHRDSPQSMNDVFEAFFSNTSSGVHSAGFSY